MGIRSGDVLKLSGGCPSARMKPRPKVTDEVPRGKNSNPSIKRDNENSGILVNTKAAGIPRSSEMTTVMLAYASDREIAVDGGA